ncbi:hypothetical protein [Actinacidiphila guanduensis]|uniref:PH domain-containing protein n=1 Tax=Actinacidiphila guanduensis TaxID=310781 RepID=A0A1H0SIH9_9ACTN|nr:hypothetical protein [Actinacidiphila guanduensis]SDP41329.1 hypothetical protein SAMN05216259_12835 [Actinacidiphila guanduensis]
MRTNPATSAEVETWLAVLVREGHLYRTEAVADAIWIVQKGRHSRPWTLHHPVLAMDFIEDILREVHQQEAEPGR